MIQRVLKLFLCCPCNLPFLDVPTGSGQYFLSDFPEVHFLIVFNCSRDFLQEQVLSEYEAFGNPLLGLLLHKFLLFVKESSPWVMVPGGQIRFPRFKLTPLRTPRDLHPQVLSSLLVPPL